MTELSCPAPSEYFLALPLSPSVFALERLLKYSAESKKFFFPSEKLFFLPPIVTLTTLSIYYRLLTMGINNCMKVLKARARKLGRGWDSFATLEAALEFVRSLGGRGEQRDTGKF